MLIKEKANIIRVPHFLSSLHFLLDSSRMVINYMATLAEIASWVGISSFLRNGEVDCRITGIVTSRHQRYIPVAFFVFSEKKGDCCSLYFLILNTNRSDIIYVAGKVKQITEMAIGVLTQCIKLHTINKPNDSTVKNILLKINSKLNGINHTLNPMPKYLMDNVMLVGADVTHPFPDAISIPSIAAVAASNDPTGFQYNITLRLQPPKQEMILDLEQIILTQLGIYYQKASNAPKRIIYYRDGVSEGQLAQVMYFEIEAIREACRKFKRSNIQITCIIVQKRHHVRLFPANRNETDDRNCNVRAGTIVDTEITHPNHIDFYLVSHASIQGTARPTKYRCICNESNMTEDQIEELTYYLCHMYARCTRSVSYPAPTYYAHLAAYRGRALIHGTKFTATNTLETEQQKLNRARQNMQHSPMCFI